MDVLQLMENLLQQYQTNTNQSVNKAEKRLEEALHKAIISGDPSQLEQLIDSHGDFKSCLHGVKHLSTTLAVVYEELKVTNVPLNQAMEYLIVQKITESRFFMEKTSEAKQDVKMTLEDIKDRIDMLICSINHLISQYSNSPIADLFVYLSRFIVKHMYVLKYYLKKTYAKLPWEEMSFCLINFVSTIVKPTEVDDIYKLVLDKTRLLNHLKLFAETLTSIQVTEKDINPKIRLAKRSLIIKDIINSNKEFEKLYYDYDLIKDVFSLRRIDFYAGVVANLDFKEDIQLDKLAIERALQVIGEALKSSPESPNVSDEINRILQTTSPKLKELSTSVRDALSHADVLEKITLFEDNESTDFFLELKKEIIEVRKVVNDALQKRNLCAFLAFTKKVAQSQSLEEARMLIENVHMLEFKDLDYKDIVVKMLEDRKSKLDLISSLIENITPQQKQILAEINTIIETRRVTTDVLGPQGHRLTMMEYQCLIKHCNNLAYLKSTFGSIHSCLLQDIQAVSEQPTNVRVLRLLYELSANLSKGNEYDRLDYINGLIYELINEMMFLKGEVEKLEKFDIEMHNQPDLVNTNIQKEVNDTMEAILKNCSIIPDRNSLMKSYQKKKSLSQNKTHLLSLLDDLLKSPSRQSEIQDCIELFKQLGQKRTTEESFIQNFEQGKFDVCRNNIVSKVDDSFSVLLKSFSDSNTFMYEKRKVSLQLFLKSLRLKENQIKGVIEFYTTESKNQIKNYFNKRLNILKGILDCDNISKTTQIFSENKRLQLATELLVLDLSNILEYASRLSDDRLLIEDFSPLLLGKSLRNYLAHGNILIDNLPSNPQLAIIANAFVFIREGDTLLDRENVLIGRKLNSSSHVYNNYNYRISICLQKQDSLFNIIETGKPDDVEKYLKTGVNINSRNIYGSTALYFAVINDNLDNFNYLLEMNADINATDVYNHRLLAYVIQYGSVKILKYYLTNHLPLNLRDNEDFTLLHLAADAGKAKAVEVLVDFYPNLNVLFEGRTPLHRAANWGHEETVKVLIKAGADTDCATPSGQTALDLAIEKGYAGIVKLLLTKSAKINFEKDKESKTVILRKAIIGGCIDMIVDLIGKGIDVNELDDTGNNSLHHACIYDKDEVVKLLIKKGAHVDLASQNGLTPLCLAVYYCHSSIVEVLLKNDADVNYKIAASPLHLAVSAGYTNIVEMLLHKSADVNTVYKGETTLHVASRLGHANIVDLLLKNGSEVDGKTHLNQTSLYQASANGHVDVVASLLTHGADINFQSNGDCTALHEACLCGSPEVVAVLLEDPRILVNARTKTGYTALHFAAQKGNTSIISNLLDKGADNNAKTDTCYTPLMFAILENNSEVVKLLLSKGADANMTTSNGISTLHLAATTGNKDMLTLLVKHVDNVNVQDNENATPLHLACIKGDLNAVSVLLANGAAVNLGDADNFSPLLYAATHGNLKLARELVRNGADILATTAYGDTVVHKAVLGGNAELLKWILEELKQNDQLHFINKQNKHGKTPFLSSVIAENHKIAKVLLEYGADLYICNSEGIAPVDAAIENDDVEMLDLIHAYTVSELLECD